MFYYFLSLSVARFMLDCPFSFSKVTDLCLSLGDQKCTIQMTELTNLNGTISIYEILEKLIVVFPAYYHDVVQEQLGRSKRDVNLLKNPR